MHPVVPGSAGPGRAEGKTSANAAVGRRKASALPPDLPPQAEEEKRTARAASQDAVSVGCACRRSASLFWEVLLGNSLAKLGCGEASRERVSFSSSAPARRTGGGKDRRRSQEDRAQKNLDPRRLLRIRQYRHGRICSGRPRLCFDFNFKTWMPATSAGMTNHNLPFAVLDHDPIQ